jgi:hypothetical protein
MKNKNGTLYYTQFDPKWRNEIMTCPTWQRYSKGTLKDDLDPDTWGEFGCLNTALLNCFNDFYIQDMTPKDLNNIIKINNGYEYLKAKENFNDKLSIKNACIGRESFIVWNVIKKILIIKDIIRNYEGIIDILGLANEYFIIKVPFQETGHYSNLIKCPTKKVDDLVEYFDVYDGKIKKPVKVLEIIKIIF